MYGNYIRRAVSAERFKEFETFFAAAKVDLEPAWLASFRPAVQLWQLNKGMRMVSFAFAAKGNALETQVEKL